MKNITRPFKKSILSKLKIKTTSAVAYRPTVKRTEFNRQAISAIDIHLI
jgi:hypothetical protein